MELKYGLISVALLLSTVNIIADEAAARDEAQRRISPIINSLAPSPEIVKLVGFNGDGTTNYEVSWTVIGYDDDMNSSIVFFDCTDKDNSAPNYNCGLVRADAFKDITYAPVSQGSTSIPSMRTVGYRDHGGSITVANFFNFTATFTMNNTRANGDDWGSLSNNTGTPIVLRWYQLTAEEALVGDGEISLLVGTESGRQYGNESRRILSTVSEDAPTN